NPDPADTVTFDLYSSATVQDGTTLLFESIVTVTINAAGDTATATSGNFTPAAAGQVFWVAHFSGDSINNPISSGMGDEPVTINPGGHGQTPGFWKNNAINWGAVAWKIFKPTDTLTQAGFVIPSGLGISGNLTLLQALQLGNGTVKLA